MSAGVMPRVSCRDALHQYCYDRCWEGGQELGRM